MKHIFYICLVVLLSSCVQTLEGTDDLQPVSRSLALSLKTIGSQPVSTKMSQEITQTQQTGNNFRGIDEIIVVPFKTTNAVAVQAGDQRIGVVELQNPGIQNSFAATANPGLVNNNNSHFYRIAFVPGGMNRVLTYGKAIDVGYVTSKADLHRNGMLDASVRQTPTSASGIVFNLRPILGTVQDNGNSVQEIDAIYSTADELIDALNVVIFALRGSGVPEIRSLFDEIKRENQILACSYLTFDNIMREVVAKMQQTGKTDNDVLTAIGQLYDVLNDVVASFPSSYGIPEGSVGFWWNGDRFLRLVSNVNIALVDPANYCYPPNLWYYTNSPVRTANNDDNIVAQYAETNPSWRDDILDNYYTSGPVVFSTSRSVAIENQLQYGVALLELSLGACTITEVNGCPLTGIIIGDQKDVDFNFDPKSTATGRYVYDNVVSGLKLGEASSAIVQTLVLQSDDRENHDKVHFALEFQNKAETLHCQQGDILPNARFYLAGELDMNATDVTQPNGETLHSVFVKDHKTTVRASVISISKAYNTVPDLHDPQLEIGIIAEMKWDQITPQSVKLNM